MRTLALVVVAVLTVLSVAFLGARGSSSPGRATSERAFECLDPVTVSVAGTPIVTTPTICVPTP